MMSGPIVPIMQMKKQKQDHDDEFHEESLLLNIFFALPAYYLSEGFKACWSILKLIEAETTI